MNAIQFYELNLVFRPSPTIWSHPPAGPQWSFLDELISNCLYIPPLFWRTNGGYRTQVLCFVWRQNFGLIMASNVGLLNYGCAEVNGRSCFKYSWGFPGNVEGRLKWVFIAHVHENNLENNGVRNFSLIASPAIILLSVSDTSTAATTIEQQRLLGSLIVIELSNWTSVSEFDPTLVTYFRYTKTISLILRSIF